MSFREFFDAYVETALWSSTDTPPSDSNPDPEPVPLDRFPESETLRSDLLPDAESFYRFHHELWTLHGWTDAQAGQDFWLTRNRHGTGFWDRYDPIHPNHERAALQLTDASHAYGEVYLYLGDDGKVYAS